MAKRERKDYKYPIIKPIKFLDAPRYDLKEFPNPVPIKKKKLTHQEIFDKYFLKTNEFQDMVQTGTMSQFIKQDGIDCPVKAGKWYKWLYERYHLRRVRTVESTVVVRFVKCKILV